MDIDKTLTRGESWLNGIHSGVYFELIDTELVRSLIDAVKHQNRALNLVADCLEETPTHHIAFADFPHAHNLRARLSTVREQLAAKDKEIAELKRKFLDTEVRS